FDYYRPEAYNPIKNRYIEKKVKQNKTLTKMRLKTLYNLNSNHPVVVIASVAVIYGSVPVNKLISSKIVAVSQEIIEKANQTYKKLKKEYPTIKWSYKK